MRRSFWLNCSSEQQESGNQTWKVWQPLSRLDVCKDDLCLSTCLLDFLSSCVSLLHAAAALMWILPSSHLFFWMLICLLPLSFFCFASSLARRFLPLSVCGRSYKYLCYQQHEYKPLSLLLFFFFFPHLWLTPRSLILFYKHPSSLTLDSSSSSSFSSLLTTHNSI